MRLTRQRVAAQLLSIALVLCVLATGAYAAGDGQSYRFSLLADGQTATQAQTGEVIPVQLVLTNESASDNYDLYTMQDYVTFDRDFFELVDGSIRTLDGASLTAGGLSFDSGAADRVYINRTSPSPSAVERESVLLTFALKVIGTTGTGTISHDTYFVGKDMVHSVASAQNATVTIGIRQYDIAAAAEAGGTITPSGKVKVNKGASQTFAIAANSGYAVQDVQVDGASVGAVKEYTFVDVHRDHTITASFKQLGGGSSGGGTGGTIVTPPTDPKPTSFDDVKENDWFSDSVKYCVGKGLMNGVAEGRFAPDDTTTRAMIVTILWRMEGSPAASGTKFADVEAGSWSAQAITWAATNGIVTGYDETSFGPEDSITREQLAAIFCRYARFKGKSVDVRNDLAAFRDADSISAWALDSVRWANRVGLINGRTATTIVPDGTATRAESAAMIERFCKNVL